MNISKYYLKLFFPLKILKNIFTLLWGLGFLKEISNNLEALFDLFIDLNICSLFYPFPLINHSFSINRTTHSFNFQLCYSKNKLRSFFERKQEFFILFLEQKIEKGFEKASKIWNGSSLSAIFGKKITECVIQNL